MEAERKKIELVEANPGTRMYDFKPCYYDQDSWESYCWWRHCITELTPVMRTQADKDFVVEEFHKMEDLRDANKRRRLEENMPQMGTEDPVENQILVEPHVTETSMCPSVASNSLCGTPKSLFQRIIKETFRMVDDMAKDMKGMETVPRERVDNETLRLAAIAVPDSDNPTSQALRNAYFRISTTMSEVLFEKMHKMILV